ncbi:hypothetical protein MCOR25_006836 [Pyricularia grisea]|nr:hypothetical protein MCOR25_006836 [Pyricularia grisea]
MFAGLASREQWLHAYIHTYILRQVSLGFFRRSSILFLFVYPDSYASFLALALINPGIYLLPAQAQCDQSTLKQVPTYLPNQVPEQGAGRDLAYIASIPPRHCPTGFRALSLLELLLASPCIPSPGFLMSLTSRYLHISL